MDEHKHEHTQQPLLLGVDEAARRLGIGRSKLYQLLQTRELVSVHVGRRRLVVPESLGDFIAKRVAEDSGG